MTHSEKMRENYEDAVFYLLMDHVADAQGAHYQTLHQQLAQDPAFDVPPAVSRAGRRTIDRAFSKAHRAKARRTAGKVFRRCAILIAILTLLVTGALAASPELRAYTMNLIIERFDGHANISFFPSEQEEVTIKLETEWLPAGYLCTYRSDDGRTWEFENDEAHWIMLIITTDNAGFDLDTENASVIKDVSINGHQGLYVERPADNSLLWGDPDVGKVFALCTDDLDEAEIRQMAEQISIR